VLLKKTTSEEGEACISIVGLVDAGPAAKSGVIRVGDEVVSVDGWAVRANTIGTTCHDVMLRLVGVPNTPVVLTLVRPDSGETFRVFLTRGSANPALLGRRNGSASLSSLPAASENLVPDRWNLGKSYETQKSMKSHADMYVDDLFASTKALIRNLDARPSDDYTSASYKSSSSPREPVPQDDVILQNNLHLLRNSQLDHASPILNLTAGKGGVRGDGGERGQGEGEEVGDGQSEKDEVGVRDSAMLAVAPGIALTEQVADGSEVGGEEGGWTVVGLVRDGTTHNKEPSMRSGQDSTQSYQEEEEEDEEDEDEQDLLSFEEARAKAYEKRSQHGQNSVTDTVAVEESEYAKSYLPARLRNSMSPPALLSPPPPPPPPRQIDIYGISSPRGPGGVEEEGWRGKGLEAASYYLSPQPTWQKEVETTLPTDLQESSASLFTPNALTSIHTNMRHTQPYYYTHTQPYYRRNLSLLAAPPEPSLPPPPEPVTLCMRQGIAPGGASSSDEDEQEALLISRKRKEVVIDKRDSLESDIFSSAMLM